MLKKMSLKINFTCFLLLFFPNMTTRTFKITHVPCVASIIFLLANADGNQKFGQ